MTSSTRHVPEALLSIVQRAYGADPQATESDLRDLQEMIRDSKNRYSNIAGIDWGIVLIDVSTTKKEE